MPNAVKNKWNPLHTISLREKDTIPSRAFLLQIRYKKITPRIPPLQQALHCFIMDTPLMNEGSRIIKQEPIEKKCTSFREEAWETLRFVLVALIIVIPIRLFIAQPFIVSGASMDPTFANGQYLIIDELSYRFVSPVR